MKITIDKLIQPEQKELSVVFLQQYKYRAVLQDTPGTHVSGVEASILKHIFKQSQDYMAREEDPRRVVPLSTLPDPRVDAVLYFLSPHYLKPQDVELMTRLSGFVPLIPIIAKVFDPLGDSAHLV